MAVGEEAIFQERGDRICVVWEKMDQEDLSGVGAEGRVEELIWGGKPMLKASWNDQIETYCKIFPKDMDVRIFTSLSEASL